MRIYLFECVCFFAQKFTNGSCANVRGNFAECFSERCHTDTESYTHI